MPLQYARGLLGLDGQPIPTAAQTQAGPPPAPPARAVEPRAAAVSPQLPPAPAPTPAAGAGLHDHPGPSSQRTSYLISVVDLESQITIHAEGETMDEAIQDAHQQYEAAQPIQILTWATGKPVDGLAREMLLDGLAMLEISLSSQGAAPVVMVMVGRLKASLGQGEQQQ